MKGFRKHSKHCYTVKNQNGFNNALYDYFEATDGGENNTVSKARVRHMLQNHPNIYYPITIIIIDKSFECERVYIETFDIQEAAHETGWL